jgi:hypothetical protein
VYVVVLFSCCLVAFEQLFKYADRVHRSSLVEWHGCRYMNVPTMKHVCSMSILISLTRNVVKNNVTGIQGVLESVTHLRFVGLGMTVVPVALGRGCVPPEPNLETWAEIPSPISCALFAFSHGRQ